MSDALMREIGAELSTERGGHPDLQHYKWHGLSINYSKTRLLLESPLNVRSFAFTTTKDELSLAASELLKEMAEHHNALHQEIDRMLEYFKDAPVQAQVEELVGVAHILRFNEIKTGKFIAGFRFTATEPLGAGRYVITVKGASVNVLPALPSLRYQSHQVETFQQFETLINDWLDRPISDENGTYVVKRILKENDNVHVRWVMQAKHAARFSRLLRHAINVRIETVQIVKSAVNHCNITCDTLLAMDMLPFERTLLIVEHA